ADVHESVRAPDYRVLLPGVRRSRSAAPAHETAVDGAGARTSGREAIDAEGARQRRAATSARHAAESAGGFERPAKAGRYRRRPARRAEAKRRREAGYYRRAAGGSQVQREVRS